MGKIILEELDFFAKHGVNEEERIIGNRYRVDIEVEVDIQKAALSDGVEDTVDYGQIYHIVEEQIQIPSKLLEHIAGRISQKLLAQISKIKHVKVSVYKYNAPIGGVCKWAKVVLEKGRNEC